jgi:hypothetical protein
LSRQALEKVAENDSNGLVRRTVLDNIRKVNEEEKKQSPMCMITVFQDRPFSTDIVENSKRDITTVCPLG